MTEDKDDKTTIAIKIKTAERLWKFKQRGRSYDTILTTILDFWDENHKEE